MFAFVFLEDREYGVLTKANPRQVRLKNTASFFRLIDPFNDELVKFWKSIKPAD